MMRRATFLTVLVRTRPTGMAKDTERREIDRVIQHNGPSWQNPLLEDC